MASQKEQLEELLASYIDGTLSDIDRRAVESYLDGQPDLRRDINGAMDDSRALHSMPHVSAPAGLIDSMQQHVEREALLGDAKSSGGVGRNYSLPRFALAAMLLAGIGVGYFVFDKFYDQPASTPIALESPKEQPGGASQNTPLETAKSESDLDRQSAEADGREESPDDSNLGAPTLGEAKLQAPSGHSLAFKNISQTSDPDLMNIAQSELTKDGRMLMKLSVDTQVVEAAEMSLTGFVTDNRLELSDADLGFADDSAAQASPAAAGDEASRKSRDEPVASMLDEGGAWSQYDNSSPEETNQIRSLKLVRNIRVDQIDTLRQLVDRAPGSNRATVVAIDNLAPADQLASAGQATQPGENELDRSRYRAQPGDRLRVVIDDPELQKKSEQILAVKPDGTLEEQNVNVAGQDLSSIEDTIATQLQFEKSARSALPHVEVEPVAPIADSVFLDPKQVVDLLVVIEGPAPLPPTTAPAVDVDVDETAAPSTQSTGLEE